MMPQPYSDQLFEKHQKTPNCIAMHAVNHWFEKMLGLLFPEYAHPKLANKAAFIQYIDGLQNELSQILACSPQKEGLSHEKVSAQLFDQLPALGETLETDVAAIYEGDPAAQSHSEVIRCYPGFYAIAAHRIAHALHQLSVKIIPRMLTESAHSKTGIDIHPAAQIGDHFFIDHGTGVVIGATAKIGKHVKIYQGVTLGGLSIHKKDAAVKRHPTIEDNVIIYAGATILGGRTIIGHHATIGGNTFITKSVTPQTTVYYSPENQEKRIS